MLKFRCGDCGQKLGVPEKYAGRKVKCTKCGIGVQVPELEPAEPPELDASELVPLDSADEQFDDYDLNDSFAEDGGQSGELDGLDALAELGGDPSAPPVAAPQAAAPAEGGGNCGKCGATVGPQAVICVQCGNNLKLGVNVKTIARAKATAGFAGKTMYALIGGAVVACIAGGIWGGIVIATGYEIGWIAWGIGLIVGFAVAAMAQKQDAVIGVSAAGLALLGLVVGKVIILQWVLSPANLWSEIGYDINDPNDFADLYMQQMVEDRQFDPVIQNQVDQVGEDEYFDEELEAKMYEATLQHTASMSQSEKDDYAQELADELITEVFGDKSFGTMLKATFAPIDGLWFLLAVSSAFRIGNGGFGDD